MSLLLQTPRALLARIRRNAGGGPSPLAGRTVLVTGASSGIGEATARAVAARGARVILVARRADELERVRAGIGAAATAYPCDLADGAAVQALVEQIAGEHRAVDYLVNNAGRSIRRSLARSYGSYGRFHDVERTMAINYLAPVRLTMALLPGMRERGFGHVVNVVTWGVQLKAPKFSAYIASKAALDTWSRIAGREFYADNITFTNMRVALVQTPMTAPTEAYAGRGATVEQAATRVVRALEDRPITVNTWIGSIGEVANLVAPRATDALFSLAHRRLGDSAAARTASRLPVHPPAE